MLSAAVVIGALRVKNCKDILVCKFTDLGTRIVGKGVQPKNSIFIFGNCMYIDWNNVKSVHAGV